MRPGRPSASDIYAYIVMGALGLLELYSLLSAPARSTGAFAVTASPAWAIAAPVDPTLVVLALTLATLAAAYATTRRLGPTLVSRAHLQWRLPLPLGRRALLTPGFTLSLGVALGLAAPIATLLALTLLALTTASAIALTITAALALIAMAYSLASAAQRASSEWWRTDALARAIPPAALLVLVAGALLGTRLAAAVFAPLPTTLLASATIAVGVLVVVAIAVTVHAYRRLDRLSTHRLRRAAAAFDELRSAALSMESTGVALAPRIPSTRRRPRLAHAIMRTPSRALALNPANPHPRTPRRALARSAPHARLVLTQVRVWLRTPGQLTAALTVALLPTALIAAPILNLRWILVVAVLACGLRAASIAGSSARLVADNPAIGRLLPISAAVERRMLSILPALILLAWSLLTFGLLAAAGAAPSGLLWLAVPVSLGLAGSSVRSAFRPPPDWSAQAIATEAGLIPTGWFTSALHGRMLTTTVLAPTLFALAAGTPIAAPVVAVQLAVSAAAWLLGTTVRAPGEIAAAVKRRVSLFW